MVLVSQLIVMFVSLPTKWYNRALHYIS